jgi:hypothetical protein
MMRCRSHIALAFVVILVGSLGKPEAAHSQDRISFAETDLWVNGANVAWVSFARDIGPGTTRLDRFEEVFSEFSAAGGNVLRLWLHTTGEFTPEWSGLNVIGAGAGAITDLRAILDLAWEYDIALMLTLWSHDMLDTGRPTSVTDRAYALLTEDDRLQFYIDNALTPMVEGLRGHPAIFAWEIFNEAEGFSAEYGWGSRRHVPMSRIQRFVNRAAGAIRRADPNASVTTGTWRMRMLSDIGMFTNYYTDERLVAAGGDEEGHLDFYTVHFYAYFGSAESPFVHDYAHWQLDKPLIVAEFYTENTFRSVRQTIPYSELYESLYDRGYAGAMGWQWFNHPHSGEGLTHWPRILENTNAMFAAHEEDVRLLLPGLRARLVASRDSIEIGQSAMLRWSVRDAETVKLDGSAVAPSDSLVVHPIETKAYTLVAAGFGGTEIVREVVIHVSDPAIIDRALGRPAFASSHIDGKSAPVNVVDGNPETFWMSAPADDEWIAVDLGQVYELTRVELDWGEIHGRRFDIDVSYDSRHWQVVAEERAGSGGGDELLIDGLPDARFVRLRGIERASGAAAGYALTSFRVFGTTAEVQPPTVSLTSPIAGTFDGGVMALTADVTGGPVEYVAFFSDVDSLGAVFESPYELTWDASFGRHSFFAVARTEDGRIGASSRVDVEVLPERQRVRYEASSASITGDVTQVTHPQASGETLLEMRDGGTIAWSDVGIVNAGRFELVFGFRLPFDSPKTQHLHVNGIQHSEVEFAGALNAFLTTSVDVDLDAGDNTIEIVGSWGWMQFDYIEVVGNGQATSIHRFDELADGFVVEANYPNPFSSITTIPFRIVGASTVRVDVLDVLGRRVATLIDGTIAPGRHEVIFYADGLPSGVYFYRVRAGDVVRVGRMILVK